MKTIYGIIGAGGYGREVLPVASKMLQSELSSGAAALVFVAEGLQSGLQVNGHPVYDLKTFLELPIIRKFNIAIGDSYARERIGKRCIGAGAIPFAVTAENVNQLDLVNIGVGAILSPFVTITSNVTIGDYFHANIYSYVAHDCVIGNYVTFAPSVKCNGNIHIGDHAYLGTGAIIKQGTKDSPLYIGTGAVIGMGAVVTKNVEPFVTVVGNPARPLVVN